LELGEFESLNLLHFDGSHGFMMNMKVVFGGFMIFDGALLNHQASFVFHGGFWRLTSLPGLLSFGFLIL
jgi:hypothetical protein